MILIKCTCGVHILSAYYVNALCMVNLNILYIKTEYYENVIWF